MKNRNIVILLMLALLLLSACFKKQEPTTEPTVEPGGIPYPETTVPVQPPVVLPPTVPSPSGENPIVEPPPPPITVFQAKSGSSRDIQASVNAARMAGGGTVFVPEGDFSFKGSVNLGNNVKLIGKGKDKTILRTKGREMVIKAKGDNIRISGFSLINSDHEGGNGIEVENCKDFRIDNLYIEGYSIQAGVYLSGIDTWGVIDHCEIEVSNNSKLGYAVVVYRDDYWEENKPLGTRQAVFIEDNIFNSPRHAVAANAGAHYVFRHNIIKNGIQAQAVDAHGPYWGSNEGTRWVEIYNNLVEFPAPDGLERAIGIRGGGGVIFDNIIKGYTYGVMLMMEDGQDLSSYPVYHQVHDLYIWNNSTDGLGEVIVQNVNRAPYLIKENRDFFRYPMPDYIPYLYPHPLTMEDGLPILNRIGNQVITRGQELKIFLAPSSSVNTRYTMKNAPSGSFLDSKTGVFSWIPQPGQEGTYRDVTLCACAGQTTTDQKITITVKPESPVTMRINTGGSAYRDKSGNLWLADQPYSPGSWGYYGENFTSQRDQIDIKNTDDDIIYQSERWRFSGYLFDLPNGIYTINLHFAETYAPGAGRRVFDISVQGKLVLNNLDIFEESGINAALVKTLNHISVSDGSLNIAVTDNISLSEINGIEIIPE